MRFILLAALVVAQPINAHAADKLNAAYINDRPAPFGALALTQMQNYGATSFNRFNMMSVTFEMEGGAPGADPLVFGNAQPLAADWTVPSMMQDAVTAIAALKAHGAQVYVSAFGAYDADVPYLNALSTDPMTADAAVCAEGGTGVGNINCTIFYLDRFLSGYGFDGLDIDIEGWDENHLKFSLRDWDRIRGLHRNMEFHLRPMWIPVPLGGPFWMVHVPCR